MDKILRNINEQLWREAKAKAALEGKSMKDWVEEVIAEKLGAPLLPVVAFSPGFLTTLYFYLKPPVALRTLGFAELYLSIFFAAAFTILYRV